MRHSPLARSLALTAGALLLLPVASEAQDSNILFPVDTVEAMLRHHTFDVISFTGSRFEEDRTQRATLAFAGDRNVLVKWAKAARGGETFNNVPRYELAAYELQKLFLEEEEYVVPPTVVRCFPVGWYRQEVEEGSETFRGTDAVLVLLQYWLWNVRSAGRGSEVLDEERFERDTAYARHFANFNLVTYLIRHRDNNEGNFLISADSENPRVFAVDNGVSFRSEKSDRGDHWRRIRVSRLPRRTIERLRALDLERLQARLGVLAQFELRSPGRLVEVEPGSNLDPGDGIRQQDAVFQLGLTDGEIEDVYDRIQDLLEDVDRGEYELF